MVFAKGLAGDLASYGGGAGGFSFNELSTEAQFKRQNLSYILETINTLEYKKLRRKKYSPVAHEPGHVFLNSGEETFANLMAGRPTGLANSELTQTQCEIFLRSPLLEN